MERLVKLLLWAWGAPLVELSGAPEQVSRLAQAYSPSGSRAFDCKTIGEQCFLSGISIKENAELPDGNAVAESKLPNHDLSGCRVGFDLGGSDRKCAALVDGEVIFSTEIKWDPYFQKDPEYHINGIRESIQIAMNHLPKVDAIGGSAAGIYINNEPRIASLFRGIEADVFQQAIKPVFRNLAAEFGNIPLVVANDGDVAALAGSMHLNSPNVLGISMGTSQAAGYVDSSGHITGWLNELAFAPVDYSSSAPIDEWSEDRGCGVQYFSQQAVGRLLENTTLEIDPQLSLPDKLETVQSYLKQGHQCAVDIYNTIGAYLGYALASYSEIYDFRHVLLLGRVCSGQGGDLIKHAAENVLEQEFEELSRSIAIAIPDERMIRHGQAIAAASLPKS